MRMVASPSRPFYLHTAEDKLNKVLNDIGCDNGCPLPASQRPASLPTVGPPEGPLRERYLESLAEGVHQGCGHVRLMIDQPADYGLDSPDVPQWLLKAFYEYWWFTPVGSPQRRRITYPILQGALVGDAIIILNAAARTGKCAQVSPSLTHAYRGGQAFVYNAAAVEDFRKIRLVEFFKGVAKAAGKTLPMPAFIDELAATQNTQLAFTINNLGQAKDCPIEAVSF
jgi:hypothetical protein